jgi:hypothetical protein
MDDTMFERLIEVRDDLRLMNNDSGAAAVEWAIVQLVGPPPSAIVDAAGWAEAAFADWTVADHVRLIELDTVMPPFGYETPA